MSNNIATYDTTNITNNSGGEEVLLDCGGTEATNAFDVSIRTERDVATWEETGRVFAGLVQRSYCVFGNAAMD